MFPFRSTPNRSGKLVSADVDRPSALAQQQYRFVRRHRICMLIVLTLMGLYLLASGSKGTLSTSQGDLHGYASFSPTSTSSPLGTREQPFAGSGAGAESVASRTLPSDTCINPFDASCWMQNAAQWIAQQIMNTLQPVIGAIAASPLNILTQTPPADTYQNPTVITWWQAFLDVVNIALACLIVIGGYNAIVGRHIGMSHSAITEFLPRMILAVGAAHFSLYFLGRFIDLENALCGIALNLANTSILTNIILAIFQGNLLGAGLLVWILAFVLGVMVILLGAQMAVRLALIWILLVLAGPGLACFALAQTMSYGRMWLSMTVSTVMVQFFQVVTLALGGVLVTSLGATNIFHLDSSLATLLVCIALLYLVLRIPGIVHRYALRPMMDASAGVAGAAQGTVEYVANVAPRLAALL